MSKLRGTLSKILIALGALFVPAFVFAHEVYVLPPDIVIEAMKMPGLSILDVISANQGKFFFWVFISIWAFFTVLAISISKRVERAVDPMLARLKPYAPLVARVTLGAAIMCSGYFGSTFGPELPFVGSADLHAADGLEILRSMLMILGGLIVIGLFTRIAALILLAVFLVLVKQHGWYMLTYTNYFGEILMVLIAGNAALSIDSLYHDLYPRHIHRVVRWFEKHAFLILRVTFGISLIYASVYAKFLHAELALQVVNIFHLTNVFPFEPQFIVLGAFALELLLGLFFIFGIEIRFASIFLLVFLTLSMLYFKETVWPHVVLAGVAIAIFMHGYDRYTLQWGLLRMRNKRAMEPTL